MIALAVLAIVVIILAGGGAAVAGVVGEEKDRVRRALRAASVRYGLPPAWLDAIAYVESRWKLGAVNRSGPDGARGGAFGPTQITARTAAAHGYAGAPEAFATDLELAAEWSARILAAGRVATFQDACAWWNAGRRTAAQLAPSHVTRVSYIPKAEAALVLAQASPPAGERLA